MEIRRRDVNHVDIQKVIVPLSYGPKERWLTRLIQDPDLTKSVAQVIPRISYEKTSITYDGSRASKMLDRMSFTSTEIGKRAQVYTGVPYNINFDLAILVKYQSDGHQIIEQILPYFKPDLTIAMRPIPALGFLDQIPIVLNGVGESDNYEGDFEHRRIVIWTLGFTMRTFIYGPVRQGGKIQEVVIDIYDSTDQALGEEIFIETEDGQGDVLLENNNGHLVDESTSNTYLTMGRVARVDAVASPLDQDPSANVEIHAITTITDSSGDVKRTITLGDEDV